MAVIVEFTLPAESFPFGRAVAGDPDVTVTLERVVPLAEQRIPFLWATRDTPGDFDAFERRLRGSDVVADVEALVAVETGVLYRVEWHTDAESFLAGLAEAGGTILESRAGESCSFTVRFSDHADLTRFHQFYQSRGFPVHIDRVYTLREKPGENFGFDLTPTQREALVRAVESGYFAVPRETTLEEIADELDVSRQAVSELVRRGADKVLRRTLIGFSASDLERPDADDEHKEA